MMQTRTYHVTLKRQRGNGYVARCVELSGCLSEGRTKEEALTNIQDAIKVYLEDIDAELRNKKATVVQVQV